MKKPYEPNTRYEAGDIIVPTRGPFRHTHECKPCATRMQIPDHLPDLACPKCRGPLSRIEKPA